MRRRLRALSMNLGFMGGLALGLLCQPSYARAPSAVPLPAMQAPTVTDRVLVVAPHPDDETLCCAGLLQQAARVGAAIGVVWITAGDSFEIDAILTEYTLRPKGLGLKKLGLRRIAEARAAADRLGVLSQNLYLLGFPDRDIARLSRGSVTVPLRSRYTGASAVPYSAALHPGLAYTSANLSSALTEVFDKFQPTIVLAAAPQDRHSDHSASGALALELAHHLSPAPRVYYWIVHAGLKWPRPHGLHGELLLSPPRTAAALAWQQLPLNAAEVSVKLSALREHHTQMKVMSHLLNAYVRANELFAPAP